jgi:D-aspartate ligase
MKSPDEVIKEYEKLLLIPCSDRYIELVVKNNSVNDVIEKYFCNKFITNKLLQRFITKEKFYEVCEEYELPYPRTVICEKQDRFHILEKLPFDFPIVLKANNSNSYDFLHSRFEGKQKVYYPKTKEEYIDIIYKMNESDYNDHLILQETVHGDDTFERVLNCYSDNNGKVRLMCLGQPVIGEYTPLNLGNFAALMTDYNQEIFDEIKKFLEDIKYVGFSNFDIKFDHRSDKYKFFEINPRTGRSSFFVTSAGYNLAEFLVDNCVYEKNLDTVYADTEMLWLTIPKSIIHKYVKNQEVLERAKRLIKENKYTYTLLYEKDMNLKRWLRIKLYYRRHIKDYKKYFFRKI